MVVCRTLVIQRRFAVCKGRLHRSSAAVLSLARFKSLRSHLPVAGFGPAVIAAAVAVATFAAAFRVAVLALGRGVGVHGGRHGRLVGQCLILLGSITLTAAGLTRLAAFPATTFAATCF